MNIPCIISSFPDIPPDYKNHSPIPSDFLKRRDPMFDMTLKPPRAIVEVGTRAGWFACRAAIQCPDAKIKCVDPWTDDEETFWDWSLNLQNFLGRVIGLRGVSEHFVTSMDDEYADLIFIDGDHHAESVRNDCKLWWPKLRPGGLMVGHDITGHWRNEVKRGVELAFGNDWEKQRCYWPGPRYWKPAWCWCRWKEIT